MYIRGPENDNVIGVGEEKRVGVRVDEAVLQGAYVLTGDKKSRTTTRAKAESAGRRAVRVTDPHVASALRNAYEEAVQEDVPSEFLELLGKLN